MYWIHLLLNHGTKFKIISQSCSLWCLPPNCTNGSTLLNKRTAIALDKNYIKAASSPEQSVNIQNNFISQSCSSWCLLLKLHKWLRSDSQKSSSNIKRVNIWKKFLVISFNINFIWVLKRTVRLRGFLWVLTRKTLVDKEGKEILTMYFNLEACRGVYTVFRLSWREPLDLCYIHLL